MAKRKRERMQRIIDYLFRDGRASIVQIARDLEIPKSTVFDYLKEIKQSFVFTLIEKSRFEKLGLDSPKL